MTTLLVLAAALLVAGLALAAWRVGSGDTPAVAAVRAWAAAGHHRLREGPSGVEVVGSRGGRFFTVSIHAGPPPVLLVAVDCAAETGAGGPAEGVVRADDGALVSRWTHPSAAHLADPGALVDAMVAAAAELESAVDPESGVTSPPPTE